MGPMVSRLARECAELSREAEAAWDGACAASRAVDLAIDAADTPAGLESAQLRSAADRAWHELAGVVGPQEANVRVAHYLR